ncbi:MAG: DUF2073 domain-containing protein [Candidatus Aenigmatarchaeota archaeon]
MKFKIKFLPYEKFKSGGFGSIFKDLKENTIILVDAKLKPEEENMLIEETMKNLSDRFKGIELGSLELPQKNGMAWMKNRIFEFLEGKKRGITIVGPAKLVRQIKRNPEELLLYTY